MKRVSSLSSHSLVLTSALAFILVGNAVHAAGNVTTVSVPAGGQPMAAKLDANGKIHIVYDSPNGPQYVSSADNGKTLSKPIALVDQASRKPGLEFNIWDMAISNNGTVHVVLGTNAWKLKLPKEEWGFMYTRLKPGQRAFEPIKNINHKPSEGFSLAISNGGLIAAVWMADKIFVNISSDGGSTFGPTIEMDPSIDPCNCCTTSSVFTPDGKLAIFYREETNNDRDMYVAIWDLEQDKATKTRVSSTPWKVDACPMTYFSIARTDDGFTVAWPTKGEIYFAYLNADGTPKNPKEVKTPGSNGMRTGILVLPTTDGQTLVAWKKDNKLGWQLFDQRGREVGTPGSTQSSGNGVAGVIAKNGDFVLFR